MAMDTTKLTEKAREAVQKRNYAYALDLYQQALALNAENVEARRELRAVASRYVKENGISPSSAWIKGWSPLLQILLHGVSQKNAEKLMIECEKFLVNDPGNLWVSTKLGLSAMELGYFKAAIAVFEDIRQNHPENIPNLYHLASAYEKAGDVNQAIAVCQAIGRAAPQEYEAAQQLKDLSARQSVDVFRKGAEEGSKSIVKDKDTHQKFEIEQHEIRSLEERNAALALEKEHLAAAGSDPRHLANYHAKIGDLWLLVEPDFDQAEACYRKARELQPTDFTYVFKMDDLQIKRLDARARGLEAQLKAAPADAALKAEFQKFKAERDDLRIKTFEQRARVRPMDMHVAFTLGSIYFTINRLDEAIGQYQRTVGDPARRIDSLNALGICFSRKRQFDLAAKQFLTGLNELPVMNDKKKAVLYYLGDTYSRMEGGNVIGNPNFNEAVKHFTQLYEADIGFKDVAKRLEELRKQKAG